MTGRPPYPTDLSRELGRTSGASITALGVFSIRYPSNFPEAANRVEASSLIDIVYF